MPLESPGPIFEQLESYLLRPGTLAAALLFGALIVPLIEEFFKPIGVWLLVGRNPSPGQGFAAGLLSGAGYALFENFSLGAAAGGDWAMVVIARIGTSLIHIVTTGLVGWALAFAWTEKRYLRLVFSYLAAVLIHGLWNGTVITTAVLELFGSDVNLPDFVGVIHAGTPFIFGLLILMSFALLFGFNAALRRAIIPPAQSRFDAGQNMNKEITNDGNHIQSD